MLNADLSFGGVARVISLFLPIWWAWVGHTVYLTRFDSDDLLQRVVTFTQMIAAGVMVVELDEVFGENSNIFALAYVFLRFSLLLLYGRTRWQVPEARNLTTVYLVGFSLGASLWLVSVFVPDPFKFWLWGLGLVIDFATPWIGRPTLKQLPVNPDHLPQRFSQFSIIIVGEALTEIIEGLNKAHWQLSSISVALLVFCQATLIWRLNFDHLQNEGLKQKIGSGQEYIYSHLPLVIGLTALGVGAKHEIVAAASNGFDYPALWLIGAGGALWLLASLLIRLLSSTDDSRLKIFYPYLPFMAATGLLVLVQTWSLWYLPILVLIALAVLLS